MHIYTKPGTYTVALELLDANGIVVATETKSNLITVEAVPEALFTATPQYGKAPLTVSFTDQSTGSFTGWKWNFGDGDKATERNPVHIYKEPGTYSVTLEIVNANRITVAEITKDNFITVEAAPKAQFAAMPRVGLPPLTVSFTDQSTGSFTGWKWNFGDGDVATEQNPVHIYTKPGTYTVTLELVDANGIVVTKEIKSDLITTEAPIIWSPIRVPAHERITFTDKSSGAIDTRSWLFEDNGATSTEKVVIHRFDRPGTYNVTLTVSGAAGTSSVTKPIEVYPISLWFTGNTTKSETSPLVVDFTAYHDTEVYDEYHWYFSDGTPPVKTTDGICQHVFEKAGKYTIELTAVNSQTNKEDTVVRALYIVVGGNT